MPLACLQPRTVEDAQPSSAVHPTPDALTRMSIEALHLGHRHARCGASLPELTQLLYRYNSTPLSPALNRSFGSDNALTGFLGLAQPPLSTLLSRHWIPTTRSWEAGAWHAWGLRSLSSSRRHAPLLHKLYVSPTLQHLPKLLHLTLPILAELHTPAFKWGRRLSGLLRPDKLVLYFDTLDSLFACAERLHPILTGIQAQGVPFTAQLGDSAILSWAIDPAPLDLSRPGQRLSWRQRICRDLAQSLLSASDPTEQSALNHLHRSGVDTDTWTWREQGER